MRVIEIKNGTAPEKKNDFLERLQQTVGGSSQLNETKAQNSLIANLGRLLDNRHVLLRSVRLEGLNSPIPMTLVGPTGIFVFHPSALKGLFRVRDNTWEKLDENTQKYQSHSPNLPETVHEMAERLLAHLRSHEFNIETVEAVLYFPDPGFHVDTIRPMVRILPADALDRFLTGLLQSPPVLSAERVQRIAILLEGEKAPAPEMILRADRADAFSFREDEDEKAKTKKPKAARPEGPPLLDRIPLTNRQLAILGGMLFVTVMLLLTTLIVLWIFFLT
jgi:hypothetical protein